MRRNGKKLGWVNHQLLHTTRKGCRAASFSHILGIETFGIWNEPLLIVGIFIFPIDGILC